MVQRLAVSITVLLFLTQHGTADESVNDQDKLQGKWQVTSLRVRGQDIGIDNLADGAYTFTRNKFKVTGALECGGQVKLDPMVTPKQIDLKMIEGDGAEKTFLGLYKFDGPKLILCIGETRPNGFTGDGDAGLLVLERTQE